MQINTIPNRTENVESTGPSGKRGARESSTGAESVFAAVFAQAQTTPERDPQTRSVSPESEQRATGVASSTQTAESKQGAAEQTGSTRDSKSSDSPKAEAVPDDGAALQSQTKAAAEPATGQSSARYAVSKRGTVVTESAESEPTVPATPVAALEVAFPAVQTAEIPAAAAAPAAITVQPVDAASLEGAVTVPAAATPTAAAPVQHVADADNPPTPGNELAQAGKVFDTAMPKAEAKPAQDFVIERVEVTPPEPLEADGKTVKTDNAKAGESPAEAPEITDALSAKATTPVPSEPTAPKQVKHAAKVTSEPAQAVSTATYQRPSVDNSTADSEGEAFQQDSDGVDAVQTVAKPAEGEKSASKTFPEVVRHVTETVSLDGAVRVSQTTETRASATSGRAEVVVERVSVQALPEQTLRGVRYLMSNNDQTMRLRLVPESLGEVRLEVTSSKEGVSVKMASANAAVREILQTHSSGLRDALSQDNTQTVRVTVTQDMSNTSWNLGGGSRQGSEQGASPRQGLPAQFANIKQPVQATPTRRETRHNGQLNIYA